MMPLFAPARLVSGLERPRSAKMKSTPVNDFQMKNVSIREDGQVMRPIYIVQVKTPAESKNKNDLYAIKGEIPADQAFRPLADSACPLVKK